MTCRKKPNGLPRVNITPTKCKSILFYHDREGRSFNWIAHNASEFQHTSADHTSISRAYQRTKQLGCYGRPGPGPGCPHRYTAEELDAAVDDIDEGRVTDAADLTRQRFPGRPQRALRKALADRQCPGYVREKKVDLDPWNFVEQTAFARTWEDWADPDVWGQE
ncbi:hypothetical protein C8J56DRAFT_1040736 [Mycena floridula]|nr:hypothetical protein C8J56DRAFT_1040736 [Mycena floridula]